MSYLLHMINPGSRVDVNQLSHLAIHELALPMMTVSQYHNVFCTLLQKIVKLSQGGLQHTVGAAGAKLLE